MHLNRHLVPLSAAAGCVDAGGFLLSGAFPANMTGNTVVLALALSHTGAKVSGAGLAVAVLAAFCLGAAMAAIKLRHTLEHGWSKPVRLSLLAVTLILFAAATAAWLGLPHYCVVTMTAFAMGLQAMAATAVGVVGISSVVVTGTLTTVVRRFVGGAVKVPEDPWLPAASWVAYLLGALFGGLLEHHLGHTSVLLFGGTIVALSILIIHSTVPLQPS